MQRRSATFREIIIITTELQLYKSRDARNIVN
jgi:hypothetical protein